LEAHKGPFIWQGHNGLPISQIEILLVASAISHASPHILSSDHAREKIVMDSPSQN
jgi:hypothetical protein